MPRGRRALLQKQADDDEFETPAFKDLEEKNEENEEESDSDEEPDFPNDEESSEDDSDDNLELETAKDGAESDDSDDAPDDVGFKESRHAALSQMREVMNQLQEEKQQLKTKRKLKDEKFKEQKKLKLEAVSRLSDDILNKLPEEIMKPKKEQKPAEKKQKNKNKKSGLNEDVPEVKEEKLFIEESDDYIPLDTGFVNSETGIKAMSLKDLKKKMAISQSAANFRNSRLYGDKRQRESTQSYLSKVKKKKYMQR